MGAVTCGTCGAHEPIDGPGTIRPAVRKFCAAHQHDGEFSVCVRLGAEELTEAEAFAVTS